MGHAMLNPRLAILPLALLLYGFFDSLHFKDAGSGLAIDPPNSYIAVPLPPSDKSTAAVLVGVFRYDADIRNPVPPLCILGLHVRSDNSRLSQDQLNTRMRDAGQIASIRKIFHGSFAVLADEPVELEGVLGHQFTMESQDATGGYEDLLQINSAFDTPSGRVTLNCITERTTLTSNLVSFGLIRESFTLP